MFLGGANPNGEAELRPASIKGALRFWWRALMWGRGIQNVEELHKQEAALFGSSDTGQSRVWLSVESENLPQIIPIGSVLNAQGSGAVSGKDDAVGDGARYFGYGLESTKKNTKAGQLTRPCFAVPFEFTVSVSFAKQTSGEEIRAVADALKLLGLCGGLGSRSRRGYGSLTLRQLSGAETWAAPRNTAAFTHALNLLFPRQTSRNTSTPLWTAFAAGNSQVLLLQDESKYAPLETLSEIGRDLVFFRSWGHEGKVLREPREGNFKHDHDLMKQFPNQRRTHPQRVAFGLPQNYGKRDSDSVKPAEHDFDRRASALFFHIHQAGPDDAPLGVLTFLPSLFLPPNHDKISVGGMNVPLGNNGGVAFWKPVTDFLTRLQNGSGKVKFTNPQLWQHS